MFAGLTFKVAAGDERARALELRHEVYDQDLGYVPIDDIDERAHHLIAHDEEGQVLAALRIVGPDQRPFDLDQYVAVSDFVPLDRSPAEIGRFCIRRTHRRVSSNPFIHFGMLKLAYAFSRKIGITDFIMCTQPHLLEFYRRALFDEVNLSFEHPMWGRLHVMHLDLTMLEEMASGSRQPMARLLLSPGLPNIVV